MVGWMSGSFESLETGRRDFSTLSRQAQFASSIFSAHEQHSWQGDKFFLIHWPG